MKKILLLLGLMLVASPVYAQTVAQGVVPGFMSAAGTNGCPASNACFVPYSNTNPLPVTGGSGPGSDVNITGINGVAPSVGNGATDTGTQRVTLSNDSTGVVSVPGVATAANQSTANGYLSNIDGAIGDPIPAGTNAIGTVAVSPTVAAASTPYGLQSAASTNATSVKGSAGVITAMTLLNTTTTTYYLRTYNLASAPTCSSATGFVRTWPIPPGASAGLVGGVVANPGATGTAFSTGIAFCLTGGPSSTDNTNAATGVFINIDYK